MSNSLVKNKVGILLERGGELLLIREKDADGNYLWNIIKGTFEPENDKNYFDAALRECKEEVNVEVKLTHLLNIVYLCDEKKQKYINQFNFIAVIEKGEPHVSGKESQAKLNEDISEIHWFSKEQLLGIPKEDFFSGRTFLATRNWIDGVRFDLDILRFIEE